MDGGSVTVEKSYEGLEGGQVLVFDGNLQLTASDDGINAASDENKLQGDVRISGGTVAIHASALRFTPPATRSTAIIPS